MDRKHTTLGRREEDNKSSCFPRSLRGVGWGRFGFLAPRWETGVWGEMGEGRTTMFLRGGVGRGRGDGGGGEGK